MRSLLPGALIFALCLPAAAATLEGVSLPDTITVAGKKLVLNGLGMREATVFKVDVYVCGLYLETKSKNPTNVIESEQAKRIHQKFVRDVDRDDIVGAWTDGIKKNALGKYAALEARTKKLNGWMSDVSEGDEMSYTYVPGKGIEVMVKGKVKGTIEGHDFAMAFFKIFVGATPPNPGLKNGMLGKG